MRWKEMGWGTGLVQRWEAPSAEGDCRRSRRKTIVRPLESESGEKTDKAEGENDVKNIRLLKRRPQITVNVKITD